MFDLVAELDHNLSQDLIYQKPSLRNQRMSSRKSLKSLNSSMQNTTQLHDLNSEGIQVIDDFDSVCSDYYIQNMKNHE